MVELFAADVRQIAPKAQQLISLLNEERQARVRALGESHSALLSLAAGLLLYAAFGESARRAHYERVGRGKPLLPDRTPFNITHAGDYAVLALSTKPVGVDLERIRPVDWQKIAERFFHPEERAHLLSAKDPLTEFFRIWTLKESYLKAEGIGFSVSPASFAILPDEPGNAHFLGETAYRFSLFDAFPGYCLSVCSLESEVSGRVVMREF